MKFSEHIDQIGAALAKAQAEFQAVKKGKTARITSTKGNYSYNYADLGDVIDATRPILNKYEIAVIQSLGDGTVETMLIHSSGQWILGEMDWSLEGLTAQAAGSAVTYGRRYHFSPMVGVVTEDDIDGQGTEDATIGRGKRSGGSAGSSRGEAREPRRPPTAPVDPQTCQTCGERQTTKFGPDGAPECPSCAAKRAQAESGE